MGKYETIYLRQFIFSGLAWETKMAPVNMDSPLLNSLTVNLDSEKKTLLRKLDVYDFRHVVFKAKDEYPRLNLNKMFNGELKISEDITQ